MIVQAIKKLFVYPWILVIAAGFSSQTASQAVDYFVFTSSRGNGEDGLNLALSTNGYHWEVLNQDRSFLKPEVGAYKLMRDPCLRRGPDGVFHLVWTVGWREPRVCGYASSTDLLHWSEQRALPVMAHESQARNVWAPELF